MAASDLHEIVVQFCIFTRVVDHLSKFPAHTAIVDVYCGALEIVKDNSWGVPNLSAVLS